MIKAQIINGVLHLPSTITIMAPRKMEQRKRGDYPAYKSDASINFRMNEEKFAAIKEAAKVLGIPYSEFIRWVAYACANEVLRIEKVTRQEQGMRSVAEENNQPSKREVRPRIPFVALSKDFDPYKG